MKALVVTIKILIVSLLLSCNMGTSTLSNKDIQKLEDEIALLDLWRQDRRSHFENDAELMLSNSMDSFISVSNGNISIDSRPNRVKKMRNNLAGAEYIKWDTIGKPIVRISDDGSMAWMITKLEVERKKKDSTGIAREEGFIYAGIMTYKKIDKKWIKEANVSTFVAKK